MSSFTYTARRSILPAHVINTQYSLSASIKQFDRTAKRIVKQSTALSGRKITQFIRLEIRYDIATTAVVNPDNFREFLDSVSSGELFTYTDNNSVTYSLKLDGDYTETRIGRSDIFTYSFKTIVS